MECNNIIKRNKQLLECLSTEFGIEKGINILLEDYVSIFTSYEEDRQRLRIIGVEKKDFSATKKKSKRKTLAFIGKRLLKKINIDMESMRLKADLFCKLWQQTNNLATIEIQEETIKNYNKKLEEKVGKNYLQMVGNI